jgi:hypothetical protein
MTCADCTQARAKPWHGYRADCPGCKARAAARSPEFHAAHKAGKLTRDYKAVLDGLGVSHDDAKAWA